MAGTRTARGERAVFQGGSAGDLSALVNPEAVAELQAKIGQVVSPQ